MYTQIYQVHPAHIQINFEDAGQRRISLPGNAARVHTRGIALTVPPTRCATTGVYRASVRMAIDKMQLAQIRTKKDFLGRRLYAMNYSGVIRSLRWLLPHTIHSNNTMVKSFCWIKSITL